MKTKHLIFATLLLAFKVEAIEPTPTDILFAKQWYLNNSGQTVMKAVSELERKAIKGVVGSDLKWVKPTAVNEFLKAQSNQNKNEVIVAVIDSGLDLNHPDLKDRIWYNTKLCGDLVNPKNQPCNGWNFINNTSDLKDDIGHGTHVAGLIAANHNKLGIAGLTHPKVKIMPLKVLDSGVTGFVVNGKLFTDLVAEAMTFAVKNGAKVINLSMGWPKVIDTFKVRQAFRLAEQNNVLVIAASGNNNKDLPTYPCAYDSVLCVGAVDNTGALTDFSNYGSKVDMVAPGEFMISTIPEGVESRILRIRGYDAKRGSSQASPLVAGVAATLRLLNDKLSNDELRLLLLKGTSEISTSTPSSFRPIVFGQLNMQESIKLLNSKNALIQLLQKENSEVKIAEEASFNQLIKLKLTEFDPTQVEKSNKELSVSVCLETSTDLILKENCQSVNLIPSVAKELNFQLSLKDLLVDSHQNIKVIVTSSELNLKHQYPMTLILSRDLEKLQNIRKLSVQGISPNDLLANSNERLVSRLQGGIKLSDSRSFYFGLEKAKQNEKETIVTLYRQENNELALTRVTLPKMTRVITVHERDVNLDGSADLIFYGLNASKDKLVLAMTDKLGQPLFSGEKWLWNWELSLFEGLPVEGNIENFSWLKVDSTELGSILVPSFVRQFATPDLDNSTAILDRMLGAKAHMFYLNPVVKDGKVNIETRVLDSFNVRSKLIRGLSPVIDPELIVVDRMLPQSEEEKKIGRVRALVTLRSESLGNVYLLTFKNQSEYVLQNLNSNSVLLNQAIAYPVNAEGKGQSSEVLFTSLLNRQSSRNVFFDLLANQDNEQLIFRTKTYDDPVIGLIGALRSKEKNGFLFFENRYTISLFDGSETLVEIPVYRDSSFPGVNFSETMNPLWLNDSPSLYINSTLIFGDRLYVASLIEGKLVRTVKNSIAIPKTCANLGLNTTANSSEMAFLCLEKNNAVTLQFFPLNLE